MAFFHPEFERTIKEKIGKKELRGYHRRLAVYFKLKGYQYQRALRELAYQLQWSESYGQLLERLTDLDYLQSKAEAAMVDDLIEDFNRALDDMVVKLPESARITLEKEVGEKNVGEKNVEISRKTLALIRKALRRDQIFLRRHGDHLFQQLYNHLYWYDAPECEKHYQTPKGTPPWKREGEKIYPLAEKWRGLWEDGMVLAGRGRIYSARQDQDSRGTKLCARQDQETENPPLHSQTSNPKSTSVAEERGSLLSDSDGLDSVQPLQAGPLQANQKPYLQSLRPLPSHLSDPLIRILQGHEYSVNSVSYSPDGLRIASISDDKTVRVWDSRSGECLEVIENTYMKDAAEVFSHAKERGFRVIARPPLEMEVQTPDGRSLCYFPAVLSLVTTAGGGRMAGGMGNQLVLLRVWGLGEF